jgi:hypothetical protein
MNITKEIVLHEYKNEKPQLNVEGMGDYYYVIFKDSTGDNGSYYYGTEELYINDEFVEKAGFWHEPLDEYGELTMTRLSDLIDEDDILYWVDLRDLTK